MVTDSMLQPSRPNFLVYFFTRTHCKTFLKCRKILLLPEKGCEQQFLELAQMKMDDNVDIGFKQQYIIQYMHEQRQKPPCSDDKNQPPCVPAVPCREATSKSCKISFREPENNLACKDPKSKAKCKLRDNPEECHCNTLNPPKLIGGKASFTINKAKTEEQNVGDHGEPQKSNDVVLEIEDEREDVSPNSSDISIKNKECPCAPEGTKKSKRYTECDCPTTEKNKPLKKSRLPPPKIYLIRPPQFKTDNESVSQSVDTASLEEKKQTQTIGCECGEVDKSNKKSQVPSPKMSLGTYDENETKKSQKKSRLPSPKLRYRETKNDSTRPNLNSVKSKESVERTECACPRTKQTPITTTECVCTPEGSQKSSKQQSPTESLQESEDIRPPNENEKTVKTFKPSIPESEERPKTRSHRSSPKQSPKNSPRLAPIAECGCPIEEKTERKCLKSPTDSLNFSETTPLYQEDRYQRITSQSPKRSTRQASPTQVDNEFEKRKNKPKITKMKTSYEDMPEYYDAEDLKVNRPAKYSRRQELNNLESPEELSRQLMVDSKAMKDMAENYMKGQEPASYGMYDSPKEWYPQQQYKKGRKTWADRRIKSIKDFTDCDIECPNQLSPDHYLGFGLPEKNRVRSRKDLDSKIDEFEQMYSHGSNSPTGSLKMRGSDILDICIPPMSAQGPIKYYPLTEMKTSQGSLVNSK